MPKRSDTTFYKAMLGLLSGLLLGLPLLFSSCGSSEDERGSRRVKGGAVGDRGRLSVLLITVDTLRPDRLSCYGWRGATTPVIDELAASGVLFEVAVTPVPLTLPSHATILTGRYPPSLGVRNNGSYRLGDAAITLAELFKDAGYRTGAFVGSYVLDACFGLDQGFEVYNDQMANAEIPASDGTVTRWDSPERTADEVVAAATQWLIEDTPRPFFAWIHIWDPHYPYAAPEPVRSRFPDDPYFGEVVFVDEQLGVLFESLRSAGLMGGNTLVVFTADHGEALGEHDEESHGIFLYDATILVPLIIQLPGRLPDGLRVPHMVRTLDIAPTILDLAGLARPSEMEGTTLEPLMANPERARSKTDPELICYLESLYSLENFGWSPLFGVRTGDWKYIRAPQAELYKLDQDPTELVNLANKDTQTAGVMKSELADLEAGFSPDPTSGEDSHPLDPDTRAKLMSLGYIWIDSRDASRRMEDRPDPKAMLRLNERRKQGLTLVRQGCPEEGIRILSEVAAEDPRNPKVWENLAEAHLGLGDRAQALEAVEQGLQLRADCPNLSILRGTLLLQLGRGEEAARHLSGLLEVHPDPKTVRYHLGLVLQQTGQLAGALEQFAEAEKLGLRDPMAPFQRGMIHYGAGQYGEAAQAYSRATELKPDFAVAWNNMGICYRRIGRPKEARAAYERSIELEPKNPRFRSMYGFFLTQQGDGAEAEGQLHRALEINPRFPSAHSNLAWLYARGPQEVRNPGQAIRHAELSLEYIGDTPPDSYLETYAEALFAGGRVREALEVNARLVAAHPEIDHYHQQRIRFQAQRENPAAGKR